MSKMYDAGITTAYGAAVRGGYEGTYEQFCTDLGELADVLSEFLGFSVTVETLAEGAEARGEYDAGVLSLGIPRGDTGNGIQSIALNADYTLTVTYTNGQTWTSGSIRGETGATPNLQIGTVSTLSPGSPATAEITGTRDEPRLNLGIPQGVPGEVPAASIAPAYDASSTYAVGEYVMYNNALYRCTTAITTAEAWTAAHWTAAKIGEDLTDCSRQLSASLNASVSRIAELRSEYELGTLDNSGQPITSTNRWRTKDYLSVKTFNAHYIVIPKNGRAYIYQYDNNKTYMSGKAIGWLSTSGVQSVVLDPACAFIKLVISHTNGTAGDEYLANLISMYEVNNLSISQASPTFTVHHGTLSDGTNVFKPDVTNTRANSAFIPVDKTKKAVKVTIPTSLLAYIWQFDSSFQFVREDGWVDTTWLKGIEDNTEYVIITYKDKVNDSNPVDLTVAAQTTVEFINVEKFKPNDLFGKALLWAHRGASITAPENTLPAIELAIEQGYKAIEVDLEFTSDNVCVLLHDKTINRTSNGTGNIYDMTYAQALTYDFGSWKNVEYAGTRIPTLKEALLLCKRHNVVLQLDIADTSKTNITATNLAEMCRVIKETGMTKNVTICAYHERLRQILSLFPSVCTIFGLQNLNTAKFTDLGRLSSLATYSENKSSISATNIDFFHNMGYMCQTWEIDTTTDYDNYFDNYFVDWMITNTLTPSEVI